MADETPAAATPQAPEYAPAMRPEVIEKTARAKSIAQCQKYLDSKQYDGRPDFFTADDTALRNRKPCTIAQIGQAAIKELVRFTYGDGRFPALSVKPVERKDAIAGLEVTKDSAELLESILAECVRQSHLEPGMRSLHGTGLALKTGVAVVCIRDGRFVVDQPKPQHCLPIFKREGDPTSPVVGMTWCYAYAREVVNPESGEPELKPFYFRRDITPTHFIDFAPAAIEAETKTVWVESKRTEHPFGVCPVVWYRNLAEPHCGDLDGTSIFDQRFDTIDALNFALSQRHRGISVLGVPQPYETGVGPDDGPKASGKVGTPGYTSAAQRGRPTATGAPARKISPTEVWTYEGENVTVGLLETTGKAFEVASKHVDDISSRLKQEWGVTLVTAADVLGKGEMSAKFLALAYAPELAFVDELRTASWAFCLRPILELMLRGIMATGGKGLLLARAADVAALLVKRTVETTDGPMWLPPSIEPLWGAYFSPSNNDIKVAVEAVSSAFTSKLLPAREAVTFLASYFGIKDVDDVLERLGHVEAGATAAPVAAELDAGGKPTDPTKPIPETAKIELAPTDQASIIRVDEARIKGLGLGEWGGADGKLSIAEFRAKHAAPIAAAAAADAGAIKPTDPDADNAAKVEAAKHTPPPFGGAPHPDPNATTSDAKPDAPPKD